MRSRRLGLGTALTVGIALAALGCFLRLAVVTTFFDDLGEFIRASFETDATLAHCNSVPIEGSEAESTECIYISEGFLETSTITLIREFGVLGLLVDPLVLQVPDTVTEVSGTWDDGSGPAPLVVTQTNSFSADALTDVAAEANRTFLIFELPQAAAQALPEEPGDYRFTATFEFPATEAAPFDVKPMATIRVDVAGRPFYLPQVPCVTDFAEVPAVTIPVPATDLDLGAALAAAFTGVTGCDGAFYDFFGLELDHDAYLLWKSRADTRPAGSLSVTDAAGDLSVELRKTKLLGAPADWNQRDPTAPLSPDHLLAHQVKLAPGEPKPERMRGVQVANLLGNQTLDLKKPDLLLLPAAKDLSAPVLPLAEPGVNPFLCWRAKYAKGSPRLRKGDTHLIGDLLGGGTFQLKKPTRLCLPADVDGSAPTAPGDGVALACFKAKAQKPKPAGRDGVHTHDASGPQVHATKRPAEFCLPSTFLL